MSAPVVAPAEPTTEEGEAGVASKKALKRAEKNARFQAKKEATAAASAAAAPIKKKEKSAVAVQSGKDKERVVDNTPHGEKKDMSTPMLEGYDPRNVESAWYAWWEKKGFFTPDVERAKQTGPERKFVMVIPPPNVTGNLHIGHALTNTVEDALTRWNRMRGFVTLWVPGTDHAGIATQAVVERTLTRTEGKTRHDLGRDAFVKKVWEWKTKYGGTISQQTRRMGASVDWTREAFTMNDMLCKAVKEAFVRMHDDGLIYRDTRLVSWCSFLKTALSDVEVNVEEIAGPTQLSIPGFNRKVEVGVLIHFRYPIADDPSRFLEVATTRIETMLGDSAVAIHPDDPRYKDLHGKFVRHPFFPDRRIPIVCDAELVDMDFGTGAVKVTPAHDANDFACGKRHNLEFISILTEDGRINEKGGEFAGQHRFECRFLIQKALEAKGLLGGKTPNPMKLGICSRSGDIIEPMLLPQWWTNCKDMARRAVEAVRSGDLEIRPNFHITTWNFFLDNIRDWCISRQLWWGHRIPAYRVSHPDLAKVQRGEEELWVAARDEGEAFQRASVRLEQLGVAQVKQSDITLQQDEDVLDTWFSSSLFPFSVLGWPDNTEDLDAFFPTTLLETGHDILFFWVARMVMMSLQLTNKLPFRKVYLHAMVRDAHGQKMSKSKGNVIDPLEVIEGITLEALHEKLHSGNLPDKEIVRAKDTQKKDFPQGIPECGADALRLGLLAYTKQGRDINLDINRVVAYRHFCNKLWNVVRFALRNIPEDFVAQGLSKAIGAAGGGASKDFGELEWMDHWILSRLSATAKAVNEGFHSFSPADGVMAAYSFWLYNLCDVYLELLKPRLLLSSSADDAAEGSTGSQNATYTTARLNRSQRTALEVLYVCLDWGLRLLHPMMPFVTEELYQRLPGSMTKSESICTAPYPPAEGVPAWDSSTVAEEFRVFMNVVRAFRSLTSNLDLNPKDTKQAKGLLSHSGEFTEFLNQRCKDIAVLAKLASVQMEISHQALEAQRGISDVVDESTSVALLVSSDVNLTLTLQKMKKKMLLASQQFESCQKKSEMPQYEEKVPEDVRLANSDKMQQLQLELQGLERATRRLDSLIQSPQSQ